MNTIIPVSMKYVSRSLTMEDVKHINADRSRLENQSVVKQTLKEYRSAPSTTRYMLHSKPYHGILKTKNQNKFAGSLVMAGIHVSSMVKIMPDRMLSIIVMIVPAIMKYVSRSCTSADVNQESVSWCK